MKRLAPLFFVGVLVAGVYAQKLVSPVVGKDRVPDADLIKIVKAEDSRTPEPVIAMLANANSATRYRAALAAGRIGDERALDGLIKLLTDESTEVREMAAFAIGEVESIKGADVILDRLKRALEKDPEALAPGRVLPLWPELLFLNVLSRVVEAAGKIAAANANTPKAKELGAAILDVLNAFADDKNLARSILRGATQVPRTRMILLGLTAVLRTRPEGAGVVVAKFLTDPDPRIRADAGNTLARLRAKNANETLRKMVASEPDAVARANAARVLGAAEDKDALNLLLGAAVGDNDSRVRVSAIRAVASLKDASVVDKLIERGRVLLKAHAASKLRKPNEITELLEIASALGRLLTNTEDKRAIAFLSELRDRDGYMSSETEIAFAHIAPRAYLNTLQQPEPAYREWRVASAWGQGLAEVAATKDVELIAQAGEKLTRFVGGMATGVRPLDQKKMMLAMPDLTGAIAALKPDNLDEILRAESGNADPFIRAAAAGAMADRPVTTENVEALKTAFSRALLMDKHDNDAELSILDALYKLDKKASVGSLLVAVNATDYLVRKKALDLLADKDLQKDFPGIATSLESAHAKHKDQVLPYTPAFGTRLGQVLNTDLDYRRALSRKNGSIKAVLTTEKGIFTIVFNPEEAPLTVDNWVKLAWMGYFNGLDVHRVVANFVMQDGDPRGDGNGGPGLSIRCEVNMLGYDRGAVGMALSGKDTGGSQWFVTHSPQPHLDGGYTVFGHVSETDMKVVDNIVRGDRILNVRIIGR